MQIEETIVATASTHDGGGRPQVLDNLHCRFDTEIIGDQLLLQVLEQSLIDTPP